MGLSLHSRSAIPLPARALPKVKLVCSAHTQPSDAPISPWALPFRFFQKNKPPGGLSPITRCCLRETIWLQRSFSPHLQSRPAPKMTVPSPGCSGALGLQPGTAMDASQGQSTPSPAAPPPVPREGPLSPTRESSFPVAMAMADSRHPVVEKVQQLPHGPCVRNRTGVEPRSTEPRSARPVPITHLVLHRRHEIPLLPPVHGLGARPIASQEVPSGGRAVLRTSGGLRLCSRDGGSGAPSPPAAPGSQRAPRPPGPTWGSLHRYSFLNSAKVISENWFRATKKPPRKEQKRMLHSPEAESKTKAKGRGGGGEPPFVLWKELFPALCPSMCRLLPTKTRSRRSYSPAP